MADPTSSGIYEIVNLVNGKRYVGSAVNFAARWSEHRRQLRLGKHHSRALQAAWAEYGVAGFTFQRLFECGRPDLIFFEQRAIDTLWPEYNIAQVAGSTLGVRYTAESKKRISDALQGKRRGKKKSAESVAKTAAAHRGMTRSDKTRALISAAAKGRKSQPRSAEYRAKLSAAHKGKPKSPEHVAKMRATKTGMSLSAEHKIAIGISSKAAWDKRRGVLPPNETQMPLFD